MIRILGLLFSLVELVGFGCGAVAALRYPVWGWFTVLLLFFSLSAYGFILRLREQSMAQAIEDAEDKLVRRVMRRLVKVLPGLLQEVLLKEAQRMIEQPAPGKLPPGTAP